MRVTERLTIADRLASEIESRYDPIQAAAFLNAFYSKAHTFFDDYSSVREMALTNLIDMPESVLGEMIDDLGIESLSAVAYQAQPPNAWKSEIGFRVFISHISIDKLYATRLRDALGQYGVQSFVAHEDIEPTLEWQVQIERALHNMDAFVSIHTKGYKSSVWCQQETGFAVAKGKKIIALRMGEDPTGFISKNQAISRGTKTAEDIAVEIDRLFLADERTKHKYDTAKAAKNSSLEEPPF